MNTETIAAVATPAGIGGVGIIRISGPKVPDIALDLIGSLPQPRHAVHADFLDGTGEVLDNGIVLYFPAPHSFTGEHVLELQGHGGPVILDMLLDRITSLGVRHARPGEFSERAFLNDRMDLVQAEAVADLIESSTRAAARLAMRSLKGEFSERVDALAQRIADARIFVEAAIDFPEEEIDFLSDSDIGDKVQGIDSDLKSLLAGAERGALMRQGANVVICGAPNAGKSSLMNQLAGRQRAIVSDIPGTTRDIVDEQIRIDGAMINLVDTAGIRQSTDIIEEEGIRRAHAAIDEADVVLWVRVSGEEGDLDESRLRNRLPDHAALITVWNKIDLLENYQTVAGEDIDAVWISAKHGDGIDTLTTMIGNKAFSSLGSEDLILARRRHLDALAVCKEHIQLAISRLGEGSGELLAEELRLAHDELGLITGRISSDELLGLIFGSFCIGK